MKIRTKIIIYDLTIIINLTQTQTYCAQSICRRLFKDIEISLILMILVRVGRTPLVKFPNFRAKRRHLVVAMKRIFCALASRNVYAHQDHAANRANDRLN